MTFVYNLRWISEDSNPWDSNQSCGIFSTLEAAQEYGKNWWIKDGDAEGDWVWAPIGGGVYTQGGYVNGWYLADPEEVYEGEVSGDYGLHITEEPLQ